MRADHVFLILIFFITLTSANPEAYEDNLTRDEFIATINARAVTWTAGINPGPEPVYMTTTAGKASRSELRLFDVDPLLSRNDSEIVLPETFDARDHWPECPSLRQIRDQGCCASCYAVSVAAAITDRWCIHSNGTQQYTFSSQDAAACCTGCGDCYGGFQHRVWWHWRQHGFVSGGERNSGQGCRPYEVSGCVVEKPDPANLVCVEECRAGHAEAYSDAKRYGERVYRVAEGEEMIRRNIYLNGPVTARFQVYSDFYSYHTGVYRHTFGRPRGAHTVKLIGWGVENGTKYWLVANTWGSHWGDGGFLKFLRGENHLDIEAEVFGGIPRYD